jgi:hypothetical protein
MLLVHDIVFAKPAQRDKVLKAANHATKYRTFTDAGFSIDDVVTLLSLRRAVVDDRKQWFALRSLFFIQGGRHGRQSHNCTSFNRHPG